MPLSKKKEKVDVTRGKGIELLSQVALTEDAQYEEVQRKSIRDFHKTHPSGSGAITKTAPSAAKIKPSVTNEGTGVIPGVPDVTEKESSEIEAESWGNDKDDNNNDQDSNNENESDSEHETDENDSGSEFDQEENEEDIGDDEEEVKDDLVKTPSNDSNNEDETKITDKAKGDEDEDLDYTTSHDDVDIRLNEPVDTDKGFIQKEGTDAELKNIQNGNENPEISQVIEDAHVTLSTVPQKTEVPVTSFSHSSGLASKFLNFSDIPHTDAEICRNCFYNWMFRPS
ncbi:hypothetical protein Tco_1325708 [Tanacetum coccineum]